MWQAPNQRVRALASAKKRERERLKRPLHIMRINAELEVVPLRPSSAATPAASSPSSPPAQIRLILNDLTARTASFFSPVPLVGGQEVKIKIVEPQELLLKAQISWCQEYAADSHVLSDHPYSYRIGVKFVHAGAAEKDALQEYCDAVQKNHLYPPKAA